MYRAESAHTHKWEAAPDRGRFPQEELMKERRRVLRLMLFILGSFSFGWVLGVGLQELGHAAAMWLTGGMVERITLSPFSWSITYYGSTPQYPNFTTGSGLVLGTLFGLVILLSIRKQAAPYLVPFLFMGVTPMLQGGGYYLLDIYIFKRGDAARLIDAGVPQPAVIGAGVLALILGVYVLVRSIHRLGITPQDTFFQRCLIFGGGVVPYFTLSLIYTLVNQPWDAVQDALTIAIAAGLIALVAGLSLRSLPSERRESVVIEGHHVIYALVLGTAAVVTPYLVFAG